VRQLDVVEIAAAAGDEAGVLHPRHGLTDAELVHAFLLGTLFPPPRSAAKRGRGTVRSTVEGACSREANLTADAPSTALRAVPLPRFAGQDEEQPVGRISEA